MENKIEIIVVAFGSIGRRLFNTVWLTFSNFTTYNSYALFSYFVDPTLEVSDLGEVKSLNTTGDDNYDDSIACWQCMYTLNRYFCRSSNIVAFKMSPRCPAGWPSTWHSGFLLPWKNSWVVSSKHRSVEGFISIVLWRT